MKIIIIRHCETDWNVEHRWQGHTDTDLNNHGREQAVEMAEKLASMGLGIIFSSPLKRARQTAEIISAKLNLPVLIDERIKECGFGKLEGLTKEEMLDRHQFRVESVISMGGVNQNFDMFGGETAEGVRKRHLEFIDSLKTKYSDKNILVIGHGRGLNILLATFGKTPNLQREEYTVVEL